MKDYTYHFMEKSSGSITIRAEREPSIAEIVKGIENGDGVFHNSEYCNIKLVEEAAA